MNPNILPPAMSKQARQFNLELQTGLEVKLSKSNLLNFT